MEKKLRNIPINQIVPNEDNPRIIFRQEEMDNLMYSIQKKKLQVPITVYQKSPGKYVLIDGERRWRVFQKLNYPTIPAIIQEKPSKLENLFLMFNIHSLREQWDLFTISKKLTKIIDLYEEENDRVPNESILSQETGLTRSIIRSCKALIKLPEKYKNMLHVELLKPKSQQKLSEDFFLEMEKAITAIKKHIPEALGKIDSARDALIKKFKAEIIKSVLDLRKLTRIASAVAKFNYDREEIRTSIQTILANNDVGLEYIYNETVAIFYDEKRFLDKANNFIVYVERLNDEELNDQKIKEMLKRVKDAIEKLLK